MSLFLLTLSIFLVLVAVAGLLLWLSFIYKSNCNTRQIRHKEFIDSVTSIESMLEDPSFRRNDQIKALIIDHAIMAIDLQRGVSTHNIIRQLTNVSTNQTELALETLERDHGIDKNCLDTLGRFMSHRKFGECYATMIQATLKVLPYRGLRMFYFSSANKSCASKLINWFDNHLQPPQMMEKANQSPQSAPDFDYHFLLWFLWQTIYQQIIYPANLNPERQTHKNGTPIN